MDNEVPPGSASLTDLNPEDRVMRGGMDSMMGDVGQMQVCSHPLSYQDFEPPGRVH